MTSERAADKADVVAQIVVDTFDALPKVGKPIVRSNGFAEWTVLSGIVVQQKNGKHRTSTKSGPHPDPLFFKSKFLFGYLPIQIRVCIASVWLQAPNVCQAIKRPLHTAWLFTTRTRKFSQLGDSTGSLAFLFIRR